MRNRPTNIHTAWAMGAGVVLSLALIACKESRQTSADHAEGKFFDVPKETVARVHRNQLRDEPTEFLRERATDPCHWQVWSPQVFEDARTEQRLVFVIVGSSSHVESFRLLDKLRDDPSLIEAIHSNYVCSLADLDANPELGPLLTLLSTEIRRPISFPAVMWMSYEGNPVAWLPLRSGDIEDFNEVFSNSHAMVSRLWREDPGYIVGNSRRDGESRQERNLPALPEPEKAPEGEQEAVVRPTLEETFLASTRTLAAMYDPASRSIDGSGGLVPEGILNLSALVMAAPGTPNGTIRRASELLDGSCDVLLHGAIRDPLDGGFFSARRSAGWDLPVFMKSSSVQARVALAYGRASVVLDKALYLDVSRQALAYTEQNFARDGEGIGLHDLVPSRTLQPRAFLWSQERLRELLTPMELKVATEAFNTSGIGNIPPESDPKRDYFRKNSLGIKRTPAEIAAKLEISEEVAVETLDAVCRRLLAQRQELLTRSEGTFLEGTRVTETNAQFVSSLAGFAAFSGENESLARAQEILSFLKARHYSEVGGLLRIGALDNHRKVRARGVDYAALLDALFAVYRLDLDPDHLAWARALADQFIEKHETLPGRLREVPDAEQIGLLDVYSTSMIFGNSTWGTVYGPLVRLHQLTGTESYQETSAMLSDILVHRLAATNRSQGMIHTDFLQSAMVPLADTVAYLQGDPNSPEFRALHRILLRPSFHAVTVLHVQDTLPAGIQAPVEAAPDTRAHVFTAGEQVGEADSPDEFERLLIKALANP